MCDISHSSSSLFLRNVKDGGTSSTTTVVPRHVHANGRKQAAPFLEHILGQPENSHKLDATQSWHFVLSEPGVFDYQTQGIYEEEGKATMCNVLSPIISNMPHVDPRQRTFPYKLYALLEDAEPNGFDHIISWQPGGKSFRVHQPTLFAERILPQCFNQTRYKSFLRQ